MVLNIAVILTCFNRKDTTLECLDRLRSQTAVLAEVAGEGRQAQAKLSVFLVDDGSTDGTGEAVRSSYPEVTVIDGDGDLFWNRGMHRSWSEAIEHGGFDYYFLLNDDTILFPDALETLIQAAENPEDRSNGPGLAIGATTDPDTGVFTYGGYVPGSKWNPLKLKHRPLGGKETVRTMNCNAVLVPHEVVETVGQMDPTFHHSWGDIDLGYRSFKAGFVLSVPPTPVGHCDFNPKGTDGYRDSSLTFRERVKFINSIRGLNKSDWKHLARRHGGPLWPAVWLSPYLNLGVMTVRDRLHERRKSPN